MIRLPKWFVMVLALAMVVGLTSAVFAADTVKGKIKSVSADKKEFVVTDKNDKDKDKEKKPFVDRVLGKALEHLRGEIKKVEVVPILPEVRVG